MGALAAGKRGAYYVWFKFTDAALTKGCIGGGGRGPDDHAYFPVANGNAAPSNAAKEIYALLLLSKKGTTITCDLANKAGGNCEVNYCELP